jgi:hypothetical protein
MAQELVGRLRSDSACGAARNHDATTTFRDGWRVIYERIGVVAGKKVSENPAKKREDEKRKQRANPVAQPVRTVSRESQLPEIVTVRGVAARRYPKKISRTMLATLIKQ